MSELNKARRIQSRKTDILCNDIIGAQRDFLNQLKAMSLQIELYESFIGECGLETICEEAVSAIQNLTDGANTAIWLGNGFDTHVFCDTEFTNEQTDLIGSCFNSEIADKIYTSRRCMDLEELFEIGLPESEIFSKLTLAVIPLQNSYQPGFILMYRLADRPITSQEISDVAMLVPGLSKAIKACKKMHQNAEK